MSANKATGSAGAAYGSDGRRIWSCVICRRRKVRCDRKEPCSNCTKQNIDCHFPVTGRLPRRRGALPTDASSRSTPSQKQAELLNRLRRLEAVVTELGAQVEEGADELGLEGADVSVHFPTSRLRSLGKVNSSVDAVTTTNTPSLDELHSTLSSSVISMPDVSEDFGKLVTAKNGTLQVGNQFWTVFCDEMDNIFRAVEDVTELESSPTPSQTAPTDVSFSTPGLGASPRNQGFVLSNPNTPGEGLEPLPSQLLFIWKTYVTNVHPFINVLDTEEISMTIHKMTGKISSLGPSLEALLFAISMSSVASLDEEDVNLNFNIPKAQLLSRYRHGTEMALARAEYLTSMNLATMQAFVIYVSMLSFIGADHTARPLTALLVRLATSMGLHVDATHTPGALLRDVEVRRRLWWQVCFVESRARDRRFPFFVLTDKMFNTELPSLIETEHTIARRISLTVCLARCRIWRLVRDMEAAQRDIDELPCNVMQQARQEMEQDIFSNIEVDDPLGSLIRMMANLFFAKMRLACLKASSITSTATDVSQHLFENSLAVVRAIYALKTRADWKPWRWQSRGSVPWCALGVLLRQVCRRSWDNVSEEAWLAINALFDHISGEPKDEGLWQSLRGMVSRAEEHRRASKTAQLSGDTTFTRDFHDGAEAPSLISSYDSIHLGPDSGELEFHTAMDFNDWQMWDDLAGLPLF